MISNSKISFKVSIVIPAFNEAENIAPLLAQLLPLLNKYHEYEIIFIDDGSTDNSAELLRTLSANNSHINYLIFSRNFGHQAALKAGIKKAKGDCVITMDADLQHPPVVIDEMIELWQAKAEVVLAVRIKSKNSLFKHISSKLFYFLFNCISETRIIPGAADFRLMDRKVADVINRLPEKNLFLRGLISWLGFKQALVYYEEPQRQNGKTNYSLIKMSMLAWDAVTSLSLRPLRFSIVIGMTFILLSLMYAAYIISMLMFSPVTIVPGWSSIVFVVLLLGGIQLLILGVIGEYLGKIFVECKQRPTWVVTEESKGD